MRHCRIYILLSIFFATLAASTHSGNLYAQNSGKKFVVVIDAGHGGHDPGAIGKISKEKNINLNVALKLGRLIQDNCNDVKIIYTRKTDIFIPLDRRAEIANNAKADLFISVHTNSVGGSSTAKGASTWTLGLAKSDANLAVAKRENSVILYESDYKTRYAGFNPNSSESYIIFEFMQDKYMQQSVRLASMVQKQFKNNSKRIDRGVHQAGFLVLKASAMPSILVELGFISTPEEERYLNSESGSSSLARSIFQAFMTYKRDNEIRTTGSSKTIIPQPVAEEENEKELTDAPATRANDSTENRRSNNSSEERKTARAENGTSSSADNSGEIVFKIQILTSDAKLKAGDKRFKGLKNVDFYKEKGIYKYTYGASTNYNKVLQTRREIASKFKDSFIIAFRGNEKMNVNEAIAEFKKKRK
jgi:N-acetylmuramoyl-L-alanine amidase